MVSNALGLPLKVYDYTSAYTKNANKSCFGSQLDWLKFCAEKKLMQRQFAFQNVFKNLYGVTAYFLLVWIER